MLLQIQILAEKVGFLSPDATYVVVAVRAGLLLRRAAGFESYPQAKLSACSLHKKKRSLCSSLFFRTRQQSIRTESLIEGRIKIPLNETVRIYQKLAGKIKELKALGMSNDNIAAKLKINRKTVGKGLNWQN